MTGPILQVALPSPLRRLFDYRAPRGVSAADLQVGQRVRVPFGNRAMVGMIAGISDHTEVPANRLKPAEALLDLTPVLPDSLWRLCRWTAPRSSAAWYCSS